MMIKHFSEDWINEWCQLNGWTDLYVERCHYWAFPPGAVMPEPIPREVLKVIKAEKGLCGEERLWSMAAVAVSLVGVLLTYCFKSPMPIVVAFGFGAVTVGLLEVELN